jgi:hypothetical protein
VPLLQECETGFCISATPQQPEKPDNLSLFLDFSKIPAVRSRPAADNTPVTTPLFLHSCNFKPAGVPAPPLGFYCNLTEPLAF